MPIYVTPVYFYIDALNAGGAALLARDAAAYVMIASGGDLYGFRHDDEPVEATAEDMARLETGDELDEL